jgi:hypothetical protein
MNRIRKVDEGRYQVLITPHQMYNTNFEYLLGNWTDEYLRNYEVREYETLRDAQNIAFTMPDLPWDRLVHFHKDSFLENRELIKRVIKENDYKVEFEPKLMTPELLKNVMFERVMNFGKRFALSYNMNDIMAYHIINPWSSNLEMMAKKLIAEPSLRIYRRVNSDKVIYLLGKTTFGTTYEIALWPTIIAQWSKWAQSHPEFPKEKRMEAYKQALVSQEKMDSEFKFV